MAQLFGEEGGFDLADLALAGYVPGEVGLQSQLAARRRRGGSVLNAIRSAASMSVTAIIARYGALVVGTTVVNVVLLPVGAAMTLLLGHRAEGDATAHGHAATGGHDGGAEVLDGVSPRSPSACAPT